MSVEIYKKLGKITSFMAVGKTAKANFNGKVETLEGIYEILMPKITEAGLGFFLKTNILAEKDTKNIYGMFVCEFVLLFTDNDTGDMLEVLQLVLPLTQGVAKLPSEQDIGKVLTYGRRYAIKTFFNIASSDEIDSDTAPKKEVVKEVLKGKIILNDEKTSIWLKNNISQGLANETIISGIKKLKGWNEITNEAELITWLDNAREFINASKTPVLEDKSAENIVVEENKKQDVEVVENNDDNRNF